MSVKIDDETGGAFASDVDRFIADPLAYFGMSYTNMHSVDHERLIELQHAGLSRRFKQMSQGVPMVSKLASRQGITKLVDLEDVVPLLFEHTMYKSYPMSLLERRQFGRLTDWLGKLTAVDLSAVNTSGCDSIDSWLGTLSDQTRLDLSYTSGTSGTMSFFPWTRREFEFKALAHRVAETQVFGEQPTPSMLQGKYHFIGSPGKNRREDFAENYSLGDPRYSHLRSVRRPDADLLWLAARLRFAASRGDVSRVDVPPSLLARREEMEHAQTDKETTDRIWQEEIASLQGERIIWNIFPYDLYSIAAPRVEVGERWEFAPGSAIVLAGGTKGNDLPADWMDMVRQFTNTRLLPGYGMTEMSNLNYLCTAGRYHLEPYFIPFVLDPETSEMLPRSGVQTGRFAFFDLVPDGHWGGLMTGDEVEVDFDSLCGCGATTQHIGPQIARLSDKRGGTDKISCAATPEAYADAMQFLTGF